MSNRTKIRLGVLGIFIISALSALFDFPRLGRSLSLPAWFVRPYHQGLDLRGGVQLIYSADMKNVPPGEKQSALDGVRDVVERRVNVFGVSEPVVQTAKSGNDYRLIVELPGVTDVKAAVAQINETPRLEFMEPGMSATTTPEQFTAAVKTRAEQVLQEALQKDADFAQLAKDRSDDTTAANGGDLGWVKAGQLVFEFETVCRKEGKLGAVHPKLVQTQFGFHVIKVHERRGEGDALEARCSHILLSTQGPQWKPTGLTGAQLKRASVAFDPQTGEPQVSLQFDGEGSKLFGDITRKNVNRPVAIFLDGSVISSPVVREPITSGSAVISGNFTIAEAKKLKERLNAGALPVPISIIAQQTVGPTLGQAAVAQSLRAGILSMMLIFIYLTLIYRWPGVIAAFSLGVYGLLLLAVFKLMPVTLTLAGLAGFILSVGMAVDANILIYERLKEELRAGSSLSRAISTAYARAWPSIRDGNLTTLITSLILMWFSTSMVKGFAVTLSLGILMNFFTAMVASQLVMQLLQPRRHPERFVWWYGVKSSAVRKTA